MPRYNSNGQVYSGDTTPQVRILIYSGAGFRHWNAETESWSPPPDDRWIDMCLSDGEWVYNWGHEAVGSNYKIICQVDGDALISDTCYNYTPVAALEAPEMLAAQIAQYLDAQGVGEFDADGITGNIFVETLPDTPDKCIAIYSTGGSAGNGKHPYDNLTVQIIVRGTQDPRTAQSVAQNIYDTLHTFRDAAFVTDGIWVVGCHGIQSGPTHIGQDENRRHEYSLNFKLRTLNDNRRT